MYCSSIFYFLVIMILIIYDKINLLIYYLKYDSRKSHRNLDNNSETLPNWRSFISDSAGGGVVIGLLQINWENKKKYNKWLYIEIVFS